MIFVQIEIDHYGTGNFQWYVKRVPKEMKRDYKAVREYFKPCGYEVRGVRFIQEVTNVRELRGMQKGMVSPNGKRRKRAPFETSDGNGKASQKEKQEKEAKVA